MTTKVYAVAQWDKYYPCADNIIKIFFDRKCAEEFMDKYKESCNPENSWAVGSCYEHIQIFEYEVE